MQKQRLSKYECFRNSDGIVFQTERARQCFPSDIAEKGIVISNAVGNELVFQVNVPEKKRKAITAAGRLTKQKDYPTLLKAFDIFHTHHQDYILEIFGDGEDKEKLCKMPNDMGLQECVLFKGAVKDALFHIASSSCYVMSSIYEGMPNALMEALAIGVPCISTDCPFGPAELVCDGENGLLVPMKDEVALAEAMCKMIEDTVFAEKCAKNAKKILIDKSVEEISQKYLDYAVSCVYGNSIKSKQEGGIL